MSDDERPKYARIEHERRWLVAPDATLLSPRPFARRFRDRYLDCGRLRLREIVELDGRPTVYKLTKKYPAASLDAHPIVTIFLTADEHRALIALPGRELAKTRRYDLIAGRQFAVDAFEGPLAGLVLCEVEADSAAELRGIEPPPYALREVTHDERYTGGHLARFGLASP